MSKTKIAAIDCDLVLHQCASAAQNTYVDLYVSGDFIERFKNKTEAKGYILDEGIDAKDIVFEDVVEPQSFSSAISGINGRIRNIAYGSGCSKYILMVDGEGNFRDDVATIKPYKGNRKQPKPYHFKALKKYLINDLKAKVITGIEADDAISIFQYVGYKKKYPYIACTIDKDAKNTCGLLYNWDKMRISGPIHISEIQATKNFLKQLLVGDSTDNIQGCRGVGDKSPLLSDIDNSKNVNEMFEIVLTGYIKSATNKGLVINSLNKEMSVADEILENGRLLWMLRHKDQAKDLWHPVTHMGIDQKLFDKGKL